MGNHANLPHHHAGKPKQYEHWTVRITRCAFMSNIALAFHHRQAIIWASPRSTTTIAVVKAMTTIDARGAILHGAQGLLDVASRGPYILSYIYLTTYICT